MSLPSIHPVKATQVTIESENLTPEQIGQIFERRCICVICGHLKDVSKFHTVFQLALGDNKLEQRRMFTLVKPAKMEYTYYIGTCQSCYTKITTPHTHDTIIQG